MFELNKKNIIDTKKDVCIYNVTDEFFCLLISDMFEKSKENIILVTSTLYEASKLNNIFNNLNKEVLFFPMDDILTTRSLAASPELKISRLETLKKLNTDEKQIIVTHLDAYLKPLPNKDSYGKTVIDIKRGDTIERDYLLEALNNLGYKRENFVSKTGEIAVRGFVVDIFPVDEERPIRFEFFGDDLESIRIFDEETQKTIKEIDEITIYPSDDIKSNDNKFSISDYLKTKITIFKDYNVITHANTKLNEDVFHYNNNENYEKIEICDFHEIKKEQIIYYDSINNYNKRKNVQDLVFELKSPPSFNDDVEKLREYLDHHINNGKTIVLALNERQGKNIDKEFRNIIKRKSVDNLKEKHINLLNMPIKKGFIYENYIFLTEFELYKEKTKERNKYKSKFKHSTRINSLDNLEIGDYVVHQAHGIGVYNGIKTISKNKQLKDYIEVLYHGNDKLYIPVEKIEYLTKFSPKEGFVAKVNRLGGTEWAKTKQRVRNKVKDIAAELINLYAKRKEAKGFAYSPDSEMQKSFEEEFIYVPTKDQLIATKDIKEDMEKESPMDRLLCGDVGYGKTEVAFRAMFKAVYDGKQLMYLCPTTILSSQQYKASLERFKNYPVTIALLNRFTTTKDRKRILEDFANKKIDILFGTHRLLSNDVKAKDLGLLVIDEEQRFGVKHKEKIKSLKENIDILTLSATPIPRTLQMSLMGIRNLSLIETPPVDRYPIQTYVIEESDEILRDSIYKEMSRGGQVFVLYNKVEDIELKQAKIQNLVPDARIINAHGQLSKTELENRMQSFVDGSYDVLLCTTIIETGIDIPNVNTLIVLNSDRFGLSQLYQIRGRVGRSDKIAFAYLMYNANKTLTEQAVKRLSVIKEFTELGSGFKIASRDLSIRGAGDILGSEQAGFIDTVGIDLYLQILDEEVKRMQGEEVKEEKTQEASPFLEVSTHIKDTYVEEDEIKIEIHQLINTINSIERLEEVSQELKDRFGSYDDELKIYMYQELFESIAKDLDFYKVNQDDKKIEIILSKEFSNKIEGSKLFELVYFINRNYKLKHYHNRISIILELYDLEKHYIYYLVELVIELQKLYSIDR